MSYWDKWYSWLFTPVSHAIRNAGQGLYNGTKDILSNDNNGEPWDLGFGEDDWNRLLEPYTTQIETLRGKGYGDLVDAALAQWKGTLTSYKPGVMDKLAGVVDGRSGRDKFFENTAAQLGEALNGIAQQRQQNEYDSSVQQAARERMAGINPDLMGTGDVAGAAAPAEDTNNVLPDTSALGIDDINKVTSKFFEAFQFASGIVGFVQDTKSKSLNLKMLRTQAEEKYMDFADKFYIGALPDEFPDEEKWKDGLIFSDDGEIGHVPSYVGSAEAYLKWMMTDKWKSYKKQYGGLFTPKQWRHLDMIIKQRGDSLPNSTEAFRLYKQRAQDRFDYAMQKDSQYYDFDFQELRRALQPLADLADELRMKDLNKQIAAAKGETAKSEYEADYYQNLDGSKIASYDTALKSSNVVTTFNNALASAELPTQAKTQTDIMTENLELLRIQKMIIKAENKSKQVLSGLADSGNVIAQAMLFHMSLTKDLLTPITGMASTAAKIAGGL